jgi:hypothetical protein
MIDPSPRQPRVESLPRNPDPVAFERWLREDLVRRFNPAIREPLPEELLSLLDEV